MSRAGVLFATRRKALRFCCFCRFNDNRESVCFQGSTANQRAIDVWLGEQLSSG